MSFIFGMLLLGLKAVFGAIAFVVGLIVAAGVGGGLVLFIIMVVIGLIFQRSDKWH